MSRFYFFLHVAILNTLTLKYKKNKLYEQKIEKDHILNKVNVRKIITKNFNKFAIILFVPYIYPEFQILTAPPKVYSFSEYRV